MERDLLIGRPLDAVETPALVVDLDRFEENIQRLAAACRQGGKAWRPHAKAHKSPAIAHRLLAAGACGITCAKLSEAELFVERGITDILIANQIVSPTKLARLARLQRQAQVAVAVDHPDAVALLQKAAAAEGVQQPVLIEIDIGMDRVGALPGAPVLELARAVDRAAALRLDGVMGYEGHVLDIEPAAAKAAACRQALDLLAQARDALAADGIQVSVVSAGGTGSYALTAAHPAVTEVQAGGGIFMDCMYRDAFHIDDLCPALSVLTTVTSRHPGHAVVDAGFKSLSAYHHAPQVKDRADLRLRYLSAEHGVFDIVAGHTGPAIGQRLELAVGYSDSTTLLHERFVGVRQGRVEALWPIEARACLA